MLEEQEGPGADDQVLEYSKELLHQGLLLLTNRDCVREGDGPEMLRMWKYQMVQFWNYRHYKYFILGHQLQASKNSSYLL